MRPSSAQTRNRLIAISTLFTLTAALACARAVLPENSPSWSASNSGAASGIPSATHPAVALPPTRLPGAPLLTPTPDAPHPLPSPRSEPEQYVVQYGDTLGQIAQRFGISIEQIMNANQLNNPNLLEVGQRLIIPVPTLEGASPDFKIIPDSELVYGPMSAYFDLPAFIETQGGYLARYREKVDEETRLSGAQIVEMVARNYSVNPRLLLAILEYRSRWVTRPDPKEATLEYPLGWRDPQRAGLYRQLAWAANNLNRGYYLWRVNGVATWVLNDGRIIPIAATINAGTAGVQHLFAQLDGYQEWMEAVSPQGLLEVYDALFGYPFDLAIEPLLPEGLRQPALQLPFEPGVRWAFTGGPHGGWDSGSAWAALDFSPHTDALGCIPSDDWVTAVAPGTILFAEDGMVLQDLDGENGASNDGWVQTGWVILYMHIEERQRVAPGTHLEAGERIGHPSCEGGLSTGTHVHLARRYNGEWIPADQGLPFVLDGWVSAGLGVEYDGYLERDGKKVEAEAGQSTKNRIQR
ncbi:MAG: LysM peptidoglycan-binding domain-containing protein [Anaerolineales bacterium]|nr:LysM peptidoglycan-binding domain-containing protein [Anaerolineales bacterium]